MAGATSPDIEWVAHVLQRLADDGRRFECYAILRPTSPFRRAATIERAWELFLGDPGVDSLRAVEAVKQHPGKIVSPTSIVISPAFVISVKSESQTPVLY